MYKTTVIGSHSIELSHLKKKNTFGHFASSGFSDTFSHRWESC